MEQLTAQVAVPPPAGEVDRMQGIARGHETATTPLNEVASADDQSRVGAPFKGLAR